MHNKEKYQIFTWILPKFDIFVPSEHYYVSQTAQEQAGQHADIKKSTSGVNSNSLWAWSLFKSAMPIHLFIFMAWGATLTWRNVETRWEEIKSSVINYMWVSDQLITSFPLMYWPEARLAFADMQSVNIQLMSIGQTNIYFFLSSS